jgi:hypothetical protein
MVKHNNNRDLYYRWHGGPMKRWLESTVETPGSNIPSVTIDAQNALLELQRYRERLQKYSIEINMRDLLSLFSIEIDYVNRNLYYEGQQITDYHGLDIFALLPSPLLPPPPSVPIMPHFNNLITFNTKYSSLESNLSDVYHIYNPQSHLNQSENYVTSDPQPQSISTGYSIYDKSYSSHSSSGLPSDHATNTNPESQQQVLFDSNCNSDNTNSSSQMYSNSEYIQSPDQLTYEQMMTYSSHFPMMSPPYMASTEPVRNEDMNEYERQRYRQYMEIIQQSEVNDDIASNEHTLSNYVDRMNNVNRVIDNNLINRSVKPIPHDQNIFLAGQYSDPKSKHLSTTQPRFPVLQSHHNNNGNISISVSSAGPQIRDDNFISSTAIPPKLSNVLIIPNVTTKNNTMRTSSTSPSLMSNLIPPHLLPPNINTAVANNVAGLMANSGQYSNSGTSTHKISNQITRMNSKGSDRGKSGSKKNTPRDPNYIGTNIPNSNTNKSSGTDHTFKTIDDESAQHLVDMLHHLKSSPSPQSPSMISWLGTKTGLNGPSGVITTPYQANIDEFSRYE